MSRLALFGFTPGGPSDVLARSLAEKLAGPLGQPVVVAGVPGFESITWHGVLVPVLGVELAGGSVRDSGARAE